LEPPRRARYSRSRSHHSHQRRAAPVEFPALAGGLQRARIRPHLLAGFRPRHARKRHRRIRSSRTTVWRSDRKNRLVIMADADPARPVPTATSGGSELLLRVLSGVVLAPLALGVAALGGR